MPNPDKDTYRARRERAARADIVLGATAELETIEDCRVRWMVQDVAAFFVLGRLSPEDVLRIGTSPEAMASFRAEVDRRRDVIYGAHPEIESAEAEKDAARARAKFGLVPETPERLS